MEREDGFYWVKLKSTRAWEPAEFRNLPRPEWSLVGIDEPFGSDQLELIGERIERKDDAQEA